MPIRPAPGKAAPSSVENRPDGRDNPFTRLKRRLTPKRGTKGSSRDGSPHAGDEAASRLLGLPNELLYKILDFVPAAELLPVANTCKRLRELVLDPSYVGRRTCEASPTRTYRHVVKTNLQAQDRSSSDAASHEKVEASRALCAERHSPAWSWDAPLALGGGPPVQQVALSSRYVLGSSRRGELFLWDLAQRRPEPRNLRGPRGGEVTLGGANTAAIYCDRWVVLPVDGERRGNFVWDARAPAAQAVHVGVHRDATLIAQHVSSLSVRRQDNICVTTHPTSEVIVLWDLNNGGKSKTVPLPHGQRARRARLLPGDILLALTHGGTFIYPHGGAKPPRPLTVEGGLLDCDRAELSAEENYLLLTRTKSNVPTTVWRTDGDWREPSATLPADPAIRTVVFFGTSTRVQYTRHSDPTLYFWDHQNNHTVRITPQLPGGRLLNVVPLDRDRKVALVLREPQPLRRDVLEIYDLCNNTATYLRSAILPRSRSGTQLFPHPDGERFWTMARDAWRPTSTRVSLIDPRVVSMRGFAKMDFELETRAADFASNNRRAVYLDGGIPRVVDITEES